MSMMGVDAGSAPAPGTYPLKFAINAPGLQNALYTGAPYQLGSEPVTLHVGAPPEAGLPGNGMTLRLGVHEGAYHLTVGPPSSESGSSSSSSSSSSDSEDDKPDANFGDVKKVFDSFWEEEKEDEEGAAEDQKEEDTQAKPGVRNFVQMTCGLMERGYTPQQAFVTAAAIHQVTPGTLEHELARRMAEKM